MSRRDADRAAAIRKRRLAVDLDEGARIEIAVPPGSMIDDRTLAALQRIGEDAVRTMRERDNPAASD